MHFLAGLMITLKVSVKAILKSLSQFHLLRQFSRYFYDSYFLIRKRLTKSSL
ncbi:hypothetical protein S7335_823 [Synechococcus sp. PCC 7335]|nr:hypothetical protein S7335_823 [Synechococcus sp. PCC 7335]